MPEQITLIHALIGVFAVYITFTLGFWYMFNDFLRSVRMSFITIPFSLILIGAVYLDAREAYQQYKLVSERLNVDPKEIIHEEGIWYTNDGTYKIEFAAPRWNVESIERIVKTGEIIE